MTEAPPPVLGPHPQNGAFHYIFRYADPVVSELVGRSDELSQARLALESAAAGSGALLLFAGEAGIGKTRLADSVAALASERGARVAWGRCWEAGGAPAYWPWIEIFRSLGMPDDPFVSAASRASDAGQSRFLVFDSAVRRLTEAARERWLLIVLDDLHAADVPSLHLLQLLARGLRSARIALVGTYRDIEARSSEETGPLLAKIAREGQALSLSRLTRAEIADWLAQGASSCAHLVDDVHRLSEGIPLFVTETLRLAHGGRAPEPTAGVLSLLDEHLGRLGPRARSVLEAAAVIGREFTPEAASDLCELSADDARAALDEATAAGVVHRRGERLSFSHILLRDRLYDALSPSRCAALHWRAGERLDLGGGDAALAAHHLCAGISAGDEGRVLTAVREAMQHAMARFAFEDAVRLGQRGLSVARKETPSSERCELEVLLAEALVRVGRGDEGKRLAVRSAEIAQGLGLADLQARAALAYAPEPVTASVDPVMVRLLRQGLAALPEADSKLRALVMARLALGLSPPPSEHERAEMLELAREAVEVARRTGDRRTLLQTLIYGGGAGGYVVSSEERARLAKETVELALELDAKPVLVHVLAWQIAQLLEHGGRAEAEQMLGLYAEVLAQFPLGRFQWRLLAVRGLFACFDGDIDQAARLGDEWLELAGDDRSARIAWALQRIGLAVARGRHQSIAEEAPRVLKLLEPVPLLLPYVAWVYAAIGERRTAIERLQRVVPDALNFPWLIIAGQAAVLLGEPEVCEPLYEKLASHRFRNRVFWGPAGAVAIGPTERTLGDLALALGRPREALEHYDEALRLCEQIGARPLLELSRLGRDQALASLGLQAAPAPGVARASRGAPTLERDGELWTLSLGGTALRLKDSKGLAYLAILLGRPDREVHVLELVGSDEIAGDAGPLLDARAKEQYRLRLEDLREQQEEAEARGDRGRAARAEREIEALAQELSRAVGLGGRDRRGASGVERARINVQRRLKDALERIAELDAELGRYLINCVKTGTYCSFRPL